MGKYKNPKNADKGPMCQSCWPTKKTYLRLIAIRGGILYISWRGVATGSENGDRIVRRGPKKLFGFKKNKAKIEKERMNEFCGDEGRGRLEGRSRKTGIGQRTLGESVL